MSLEAWGDENPADADFDSWADRAMDAGWFDPEDFSKGAIDVLKERERQETTEGWTDDHDDGHYNGEMGIAAACYTVNACAPRDRRDEIMGVGIVPPHWPWDAQWWKPKSRREDLVRAAALIIAEIDRLDRLDADNDPSGDGLA